MITAQRKRRLAVLCVICVLACMAFLGAATGVTADSIANSLTSVFVKSSVATYSPDKSYGQGVALIPHQIHPLHGGRDWQIAEVDDVFADVVVDSTSSVYAD